MKRHHLRRDWNGDPLPDPKREHPGMAEALRMARELPARTPTEADAPPASAFPMTRGAREALRLTQEHREKLERGEL